MDEVYVSLHYANVFIEDNIYGIKVIPLTTLLVMKIGVSDAKLIQNFAMAIAFPSFFFSTFLSLNIHEFANDIIFI